MPRGGMWPAERTKSSVEVGGDLNVAALEKARSDDRNRELGFTYLLFDAVHFPLRRSFDLILFRSPRLALQAVSQNFEKMKISNM